MTPKWKSIGQVWTGEVIITHLTTRGKGVHDSPIRVIRQVWSLEGELIAEYDPTLETEN